MGNRSYYLGLDRRGGYLSHYGVGHDKGGHSGRYPWGSGKDSTSGRSATAFKQKGRSEKDQKKRRNEAEDRSMFEGTAVALETMIDIMKRSPKPKNAKSRRQLDYMRNKLKLFQKLADGGDYTDAQLGEAQEASQLIWELMDEYDE